MAGCLSCNLQVAIYKQQVVTYFGPVMKRFLTRETGAFAMMVATSVLFVQLLKRKVGKCD